MPSSARRPRLAVCGARTEPEFVRTRCRRGAVPSPLPDPGAAPSIRPNDRPLFLSFSPTNDGRFAGGAFLFCPHPHVRCRPTAERRRRHEGGRTAPDRSFQGGGGQAVEARHRSFRLRLRRLALQLARGSRSFRAVPCGGVSVGQRLVDMVQILFRYSSDMVQIWFGYVCGSAARSVVS